MSEEPAVKYYVNVTGKIGKIDCVTVEQSGEDLIYREYWSGEKKLPWYRRILRRR